MKNEPEIVRCPKAASGKCSGFARCNHHAEHVKNYAGLNCSITRMCPACEPAKPKNVVALLKSIAHWDLIAQGLEESQGTENCECCKQSKFVTAENSCGDCLIGKAGFEGCDNTPYMEMVTRIPTKNQTPKALDAIEAEVEFLISCLPEAEQKAFSLENIQPFLRFGDKVWIGEEQVGFIDYPTNAQRCRIMHLGSGRFENVALSKLSLFPPKPKPQLWETLEVGQPVVVWDDNKEEQQIYFFRSYNVEKHYPVNISRGLDLEESYDDFENFRLPTRAEAQKLGFDLNRWQWAD